jgi:hypothetical protein
MSRKKSIGNNNKINCKFTIQEARRVLRENDSVY